MCHFKKHSGPKSQSKPPINAEKVFIPFIIKAKHVPFNKNLQFSRKMWKSYIVLAALVSVSLAQSMFGQPCTENSDCQKSIPNSICQKQEWGPPSYKVNHACRCPDDYDIEDWEQNKCLKLVHQLGADCESDMQCSHLGNSDPMDPVPVPVYCHREEKKCLCEAPYVTGEDGVSCVMQE